jgi:hypothetical protein
MTKSATAVADAADRWLRAKEAILAADEARQPSLEKERALDRAELYLTKAVIGWRITAKLGEK